MRVPKQLPVPECDGDDWYDRIRCAWDDCANPASRLHTFTVCHAAGIYRHDTRPRDKCYSCETKAFCCAQHRDYESRCHRPGEYGRLGREQPRFISV